MKVYVNELPKDCISCPCESESYCNLLNEYVDYCKYSKINEGCPLQSLSDHTHQVKREVLCELMDMLGDRAELIDFGNVSKFMFTTYDLQMCVEELLNQNKGTEDLKDV